MKFNDIEVTVLCLHTNVFSDLYNCVYSLQLDYMRIFYHVVVYMCIFHAFYVYD